MAYGGDTEIFNDGWREPGDDCERLAHYILLGIGTLAGYGMAGAGFVGFVRGHVGDLLLLVLGALVGGGGTTLFVKESRHWDLRHMTADRFVAGGFLFGFALILLGLQIGSRTGSVGSHVHTHGPRELEAGFLLAAWFVGGGIVWLTLFLLLGLGFAYAPALRIRRRLAGTRIERRYALDDKLNEIDGHPCPRTDGFTPVVTLRLRDGRTRTMVCAESAYETLRVGMGGTAVVRGRRLERLYVA